MPWKQPSRSDERSKEIDASAAFTTTYAWSDPVDMRAHDLAVVWLVITGTGSNTTVHAIIDTSDDGSTIAFNGDAILKADDGIDGGVWSGHAYDLALTGSTLTTGKHPIRVPRCGGFFRVGVKGTNASGAYSVRVQRFA